MTQLTAWRSPAAVETIEWVGSLVIVRAIGARDVRSNASARRARVDDARPNRCLSS